MIKAAVLAFLLTASAARGGVAEDAAQASADLQTAVAALEEASAAKDRVAALTRTIKAYEEGLAALRQLAPASQHVIFLDPPFDGDLYEAALTAAACAIASTGFVYLEAPKAWTDAMLNPLGWTLHRHLKAGAVHAHLLRVAVSSTPD